MRNKDQLMPVWKIIATVAVCWCFSSRLASGQGDAAGRHEQFIASLKRIAADITSRALDDVASLDDWKETRTVQYKHFMYTMGLDPMPERTPLRARITGTLKRSGYNIEKIVFQSSPGLYVTGNLYLPHELNGGVRNRLARYQPSSTFAAIPHTRLVRNGIIRTARYGLPNTVTSASLLIRWNSAKSRESTMAYTI